MPPVIAVAGISGVGKSTLLARIANSMDIQILQASALIREARPLVDGKPPTLDELREVDLDENQRLLIRGFLDWVDREAALVALDCHTIVETGEGLVYIHPRVFKPMNLKAIVFLKDDPEKIAQRRKDDHTRKRPSAIDIGSVQTSAINQAHFIADSLNVPLFIHRPAGEDWVIVQRLRSYLTSK